MAEVPSRRQIGWQGRWSQRVWLRGFLSAVLLLILWVFSMGCHLLWFGVPPVEPRANLGRGCVLVCWQTKATWHLIGAPTTLLGLNLNVNGVRLTWYASEPLWDVSYVKDVDLNLIIKAGVVQLPLFYLVLLAATLPAILYIWRRTRLQPWQCIKCRYDLRNSTGLARCPECGNTFTMTEAHTPKP